MFALIMAKFLKDTNGLFPFSCFFWCVCVCCVCVCVCGGGGAGGDTGPRFHPVDKTWICLS